MTLITLLITFMGISSKLHDNLTDTDRGVFTSSLSVIGFKKNRVIIGS